MKYTIEISDTQQRIIDVLEAVTDNYADYSFSPNNDRTDIDFSYARISMSGCQDTRIDINFEKNSIWLVSHQHETKNDRNSIVCDRFRAQEHTLIATARALDPSITIIIKKSGFQEDASFITLSGEHDA